MAYLSWRERPGNIGTRVPDACSPHGRGLQPMFVAMIGLRFQIVMQFLLLPMLFLSGALFPLSGLPSSLTVLTRINPVTYAVDPLRRAVFAAQDISPAAIEQFGAGVSLFGRTLSVATEVAIVALLTVAFLALAIRGFARKD